MAKETVAGQRVVGVRVAGEPVVAGDDVAGSRRVASPSAFVQFRTKEDKPLLLNGKHRFVAFLEKGLDSVLKEYGGIEKLDMPGSFSFPGHDTNPVAKGVQQKVLKQTNASFISDSAKSIKVSKQPVVVIVGAPPKMISEFVLWLYTQPRDGIHVLKDVTPQSMEVVSSEGKGDTGKIDLSEFAPAVERKQAVSSFREKAVMLLASAVIGSATGFGLSRLFPSSPPTPLLAAPASPGSTLAAVVDTESTLVTSGISLAIDKIERGLPKDSPLRKELVRTLGDAFERSARIARASPTL